MSHAHIRSSAAHARSTDPGPLAGRSFDGLFEREFSAMVALAYATSGNRSVAEDIAQDAFMAAYRDWDRVSQLDNPTTWVRRVVINKSVSSIRTRPAGLRAAVRLRASAQAVELPEVTAETEHLWNEVRRLPNRQRQAVALRFANQLTLEEIGKTLGCSKNTANTHLRRVTATLAERVRTEEHA